MPPCCLYRRAFDAAVAGTDHRRCRPADGVDLDSTDVTGRRMAAIDGRRLVAGYSGPLSRIRPHAATPVVYSGGVLRIQLWDGPGSLMFGG